MPVDPNTQAILDAISASFDRFGKTVFGAIFRVFGSLSGKNEEPYFYCVKGGSQGGDGFINLSGTVGATGNGSIHVDQSSDFLATNIMAISVVTSTGVIMPPQTATGPSFQCLMKNAGTDRQFSNVAAHNETIFGTGQRAVRISKNWLIRRNADISVALTNLQAVATQVWLGLWGWKIYDKAALDLVGKR